MKKLNTILSIAILAILSMACQKVIDLQVKNADPQVAVEGVVSNHPGESYVKLTWTKAYISDDQPSPVDDALVFLIDDAGNKTAFTEKSLGQYIPAEDFVGQPGVSYQLHIEHSGGYIVAVSNMPEPALVEDLELIKANSDDPRLEAGYYLYGLVFDQDEAHSYFKAESYINGIKVGTRADDLVTFNDQYFDTQGFAPVELAFWEIDEERQSPLQIGDSISVRVLSISQATFEYYNALSDLPMQGGIFGRNPANVPCNIQGGLGWFYAYSYTQSKSVIVSE